MQALLDAGADVNARSEDRRSRARHHRRHRRREAGAEAAARLRRRPVALESAADPVPLREAARVNDVEMFRLMLPYVGGPKSARRAAGGVHAQELFFLRGARGRRRGWTAAPGPPTSEAGSTAPRYDPGRSARPTPIGETAADARRRFAPPFSAACRCCRTSALRSSTRPAACPVITTASSRWRWRRRARTATRSTRRRRKRRSDAIGDLSRVVARARRAEHPDCRRRRHDELPAAGPGRRSLSRRMRRPMRRRSG